MGERVHEVTFGVLEANLPGLRWKSRWVNGSVLKRTRISLDTDRVLTLQFQTPESQNLHLSRDVGEDSRIDGELAPKRLL